MYRTIHIYNIYIYIYIYYILWSVETRELAAWCAGNKSPTFGRGKYAVGGKWKRIFGSAYLKFTCCKHCFTSLHWPLFFVRSCPLHLSHLVTCPCCQRTAGRLHWECHTFCLVRIARRTEPFELPSGRFWFISYAAMQKTTPLDRQWSRPGPRLFGFATRRCATFREPMDFFTQESRETVSSTVVHLASCWRITWALRTLGLRFVSTHPVRLCMDPGKCRECVLAILWSISQFDKASNSICMVSQGEEGLRGYVER